MYKRLLSLNNLLVIHPFLFAIFPILALYANNMQELTLSELWIPCVIAVGTTLMLLLFLRIALKNAKKAAIIASLFLILFFSYGHALNYIIHSWGIGNLYIGGLLIGTPLRYLLLIWAVVFSFAAYLIVRTKKSLYRPTQILNVIAVTLVIVSSINILVYELKRPSTILATLDDQSFISALSPEPMETFPDIYYIILDAYANTRTLEEFYGFSNNEFIDYLSDRGFYLAYDSMCNHSPTGHSLASSLNMQYLTYLSEEIGEDVTDLSPLYDLVLNNRVGRLLKSIGYKWIHIGSRWEMTKVNRYADVDFTSGPKSGLVSLLYETTLLRAVPSLSDSRLLQYENALYQFATLKQVAYEHKDIDQPIFVFAHISIPHVPHVFGRDGSYQPKAEEEHKATEDYVDQLIACNQLVMSTVDDIFTSSRVSPIVILQSDHGPGESAFTGYSQLSSEQRLKVTGRILNAYYLPNMDTKLLYDSITPVNSFRVIFNNYFGANYHLLDDEMYGSKYNRPYHFTNLTHRLGNG